MARNILIFAAHGDDEIVGMGGTLLKCLDEGNQVIEVIFTQGSMSHPHFKEEVIVGIRKKEMQKIADKIGIKEVIYFDLKDLQLQEQIKKPAVKVRIKRIIERYNPEKIFTLSSSETHPDHRAVNEVILKVADSLKQKYPVYTFHIWTTPSLKNAPIIYMDISKYFWKKIKLMKQHRSQWLMMYYQQILPVIFRACFYGIKNNCKYAEKFEKVR